MSRLHLVSTSLFTLALAACGGPAEPPSQPTEPAPPPPVADPVSIEAEGLAETADPVITDAEPVEDLSDEHDHADDEDHHDHPEDDHGDDHGEEFVGEAHVHGAADGALVLDGAELTVSFNAPLASLGGREAEPDTPDELAARELLRGDLLNASAIVDLNSQAGCVFTGSDVLFRYAGDHGSADATYIFTCASPGDLDEITLTAFETFEALETVELAVLDGVDQTGVELDRDTRSLTWP
ncbi:MAG: DUF2796 domain-containing protein [Pseudomonadota bacterium]